MSTLKDRAAGLTLWVTEGAKPADVAERLVAADRDAQFWNIARMLLPADTISRIEHATTHLMAHGYNPDAVENGDAG